MAAFNRERIDVESIRSNYPLPAVVSELITLRRSGDEWKACCPFHEEKNPSFTIYNGGERFYCFGCGAKGDVLDYVRLLHGLTLPQAAARLQGESFPTLAPRPARSEVTRDTTAEAILIWNNAVAAEGTPADTYLRSRGLHLAIPETIRFARLKLGWREAMPCLVALVSSAEGKDTGIQRTFLTEDGRKASLPHGKVKFSLGRIRGGAIRLAPVANRIIVTEGLEDALTLQQQLAQAVWVAAGATMMPSMQFPVEVRSVVVGADNDKGGRENAWEAAKRFNEAGLCASIIRPNDGFKDFNAELMGASA